MRMAEFTQFQVIHDETGSEMSVWALDTVGNLWRKDLHERAPSREWQRVEGPSRHAPRPMTERLFELQDRLREAVNRETTDGAGEQGWREEEVKAIEEEIREVLRGG